jgi:hypothetical protein
MIFFLSVEGSSEKRDVELRKTSSLRSYSTYRIPFASTSSTRHNLLETFLVARLIYQWLGILLSLV